MPGLSTGQNCKYLTLLQNITLSGNRHHLPRDEFSALLQSFLYGKFDTAAAGNFHSHHGNRADIVLLQNLGQFDGIVHTIQFWTADQRDVTADEVLMEIGVSVSGAVRCNQQPCTVKPGRANGSKLDLYRPLTQLGFLNHRCRRCGAAM